MSRYISNKIREEIVKKQHNKCATISYYNCRTIEFDDAGFEIDHIKEYTLTKCSNINNLQALCPGCHAVKTKRFRQYRINRKYFNYNYSLDMFDMITNSYKICKESIKNIINNYDYDKIIITNWINNAAQHFHIYQFNKLIDCSLMINYLSESFGFEKNLPEKIYKNNIFIILAHKCK